MKKIKNKQIKIDHVNSLSLEDAPVKMNEIKNLLDH